MKLKKIIAIVAVAALALPAMAREHIEREYLEWTDVWLPGAERADLPHILIIGNSITKGYTPKVEKALEGRAYVGRFSNSKCLGDPALLDELESVLKHNKFDIIHFNNGLHGAGYSEEEYDKAFPKLIKPDTQISTRCQTDMGDDHSGALRRGDDRLHRVFRPCEGAQ